MSAPGIGSQPPQTLDASLVLEVRTNSHFGGPSGYRILTDGRYEMVGEPGEGGVCGWELLRQLSDDELTSFRALMDGLGLAKLRDRYAPAQQVMDGGSTTWRMRVGDTVKVVTVDEGTDVPALETLWAALPEVAVSESDTIVWTVSLEGLKGSWSITCAPTDVPGLDGLTWAMARGGEEVPGGGPAADASMLLLASWMEKGTETSRQELWSDGWQMIKAGDEVFSAKRHTDDEMADFRAKIGALAWDDVASRCP